MSGMLDVTNFRRKFQ